MAGNVYQVKACFSMERVIVYVVNTQEVGGDEYWLVVFFLDLFEFLESGAASFGKSPEQIFANHLFYCINFIRVLMI